ncbi:MAG: YhcH/YjgK/YiaL family protein [Calditrichaeota bacterium]|nr:YhcH/YjgK/YiaL family protein [Calditrichota bacterium]
MIFDRIQNAALYRSLSPLLAKSFDYIQKQKPEDLSPGKHVIDADRLFVIAMDYETKKQDECVLESHFKYIDLHYYFSGTELIGIGSLTNQDAVKTDKTADYSFYEAKEISLLGVEPGHFAVFFPDDLHMTGIIKNKKEAIRKLVFKLAVESF